jgi:hypothetical protein
MAPVSLTGVVNVEFELPSVEPQAFYAKGDIVWSDSFMMGLRFLHIEKHSGVALQTWLGLLEAQSRFHEMLIQPIDKPNLSSFLRR